MSYAEKRVRRKALYDLNKVEYNEAAYNIAKQAKDDLTITIELISNGTKYNDRSIDKLLIIKGEIELVIRELRK